MSKLGYLALSRFTKLCHFNCNCRTFAISGKYLLSAKDSNSNDYIKNMSEEYMYPDEPLDQKRARLHWQSRKRGIAETCLIFSTFSSKHLNNFSEVEVDAYDRLLNKPSNDWDVYYWMVGHKPVPDEYNNEIMKMLQLHCRNEKKEQRFQQPDLNYNPVK